MVTTETTDVLVIGGGPAGLATAVAARMEGLCVILADRRNPPIDKACGEGLLPDGVRALAALGVTPRRGEIYPFRGIRFLDDQLAAEAEFPGARGMGIRRALLHRLLVERAQQTGVAMHWGVPVTRCPSGSVNIGKLHVSYRWLVGADGAQSSVRRWASLPVAFSTPRRWGLRQHFRLQPWSDCVEVYWHNDAQAYVTPVGREEVCVAVLGSPPEKRLADIPSLFPGLAQRLAQAEKHGALRGATSASVKLRRVTLGRVALVGDASGSPDAVTGEGVSLALRQAIHLARALAADDLTYYEIAHRRLSRVPHLMGHALLYMGSHERLRRRAIQALAAKPSHFGHLLATHVGARRPASCLVDLVGFGWSLAAPQWAGTSASSLAVRHASSGERHPREVSRQRFPSRDRSGNSFDSR